MIVLVIASVLWLNVLFVAFRMWAAREVQADSRRAAGGVSGGRRRPQY